MFIVLSGVYALLTNFVYILKLQESNLQTVVLTCHRGGNRSNTVSGVSPHATEVATNLTQCQESLHKPQR